MSKQTPRAWSWRSWLPPQTNLGWDLNQPNAPETGNPMNDCISSPSVIQISNLPSALWGWIWPPTCCYNKVLLAHGHVHALMYHLCWLLSDDGRVLYLLQTRCVWPRKPKIFALLRFTMCPPCTKSWVVRWTACISENLLTLQVSNFQARHSCVPPHKAHSGEMLITPKKWKKKWWFQRPCDHSDQPQKAGTVTVGKRRI